MSERVNEIAARLERATAKPWTTDERLPYRVYCDDSLGSQVARCDMPMALALTCADFKANAEFIANAPADVEYLLAEIIALTARAVRAEEECTFLRTAIRDACLSLSAPAQDVGVRASRVAHHLQATLDSSPRPATP